MADRAVSVQLDDRRFQEIIYRIKFIQGGVRKAMAMAANETAKAMRTEISRKIRDRVNIKKRDIDKNIEITRATPERYNVKATVRLSKTKKIPIAYFGGKQSKHGVRYKIDKGGANKLIPGAFGTKIPRLGNQVFAREILKGAKANKQGGARKTRDRRKGASPATAHLVRVGRLPIRKIFGPSPWGVFVKADLMGETLVDSRDEMEWQLIRAVRFIALKHEGKI